MNKNILIFLSTFDKKDASMEEKTNFIIEQAISYSELCSIGEVFDYRNLPYNNPKGLKKYISDRIKEKKPEWIVGLGTSATILMGMKIPRRILIDPKVSYVDLNHIAEYVRQTTFGFFDQTHEKDYERFQSVYPNSAWYPENCIDLSDLKPLIETIIREDINEK